MLSILSFKVKPRLSVRELGIQFSWMSLMSNCPSFQEKEINSYVLSSVLQVQVYTRLGNTPVVSGSLCCVWYL